MGRKGGGRKGFLKAAGRGPESDEAENAGHSEGGDAGATREASVRSNEVTSSSATDAPNAPRPEPATAAAEPDPCRESDEGDEDAKPGIETQGQVIQRHKRELKAHKEAAKRLGKKKKDEMAQVEKEMLERHALELRAVEEAAEAAAAAQAAAEKGGVEQELQGMRLGPMGSAAAQRLKPSKAQRRREKLAQAERQWRSCQRRSSPSLFAPHADPTQAERGERIAQELAMLGETEGQREEAALRSMLAPQGLVVQDIQADGHCLYRALEHQLSITGAVEGGSSFRSYQELRALAARWILQHPDDFLPFILDHDSELDAQQQLESYCATLEGSAAWGGQLELTALAAALQRPIHVHSVGMPLLKMGAEHEQAEGSAAALQVCYQRHAFSLGEHYSSVVPVSLPSAGAAVAAGDGD